MAFDPSSPSAIGQRAAPPRHEHSAQEGAEDWTVDNWNNEVFKFEQNSLIKNKLGLIVNKRYQIVQRIDAGAFGSTYIGEDLKNNRQRVAVKFDTGKSEWKKSKKDENHLKYEFEVYKSALYDDGFEAVEGFAQVYWFGCQYGHNILVMELLGASVASLFGFCDRKFGWQTVLSLAQQMLFRIRHIHQRGFIHRDLKPENFLMGMGENESTCYLIDFGLARRYRFRHPEDRTLKHIPFRRGRSFIGTAKYASVNSHRSVELSRRDDLESLGYVLIELINGNLPWKNICRRNQNNKHQTYMRIRAAKEQANWQDICPPMAEYMRYCRELQFAEEPDYDKLLLMLRVSLAGGRISSLPAKMPLIKCEACRALNAVAATDRDVRLRIERIEEEENSPAISPPPSDPQTDRPRVDDAQSMLAAGASFNFLFPPNMYAPQNVREPTAMEKLAFQFNGAMSMAPTPNGLMTGGPLFAPTFPAAALSSAKMTQSSVDNFSQHSSLENLKSANLSANADLNSPARKANSEATTEEDADSVKSCHNCRQQRRSDRTEGDAKLSWQVWRDSTPENRFEYDNRFSWTLPVALKPSTSSTPLANIPLPTLDFSRPPPNFPPFFDMRQRFAATQQNAMKYPPPPLYHPQSGPPSQSGFFTPPPGAPIFCMFPPPSSPFVPT